jgi:hypothetical protein
MSCAIMSRPLFTSRLVTTGYLTSAEDLSPAPISGPPLPLLPAARRSSVRLLGNATAAPGSRSYARAGSAEPPGALRVGGRGAAPGMAANAPEEVNAEVAAGGGGAGDVDGGAGEGVVDCKVAGGRCGGTASVMVAAAAAGCARTISGPSP